MGLVGNSDVAAFLNVQSPTTEQSKWMTTLIDGVSKAVQNHCGRDLAKDTYTEYYDGSGRPILKLRQYPVISVSSVIHIDINGVEWIVELTDFVQYLQEGWLKLKPIAMHSTTWVKGDQDYKIVYIAGYDPLSPDIEMACLKWVAVEFQKLEHKLHAIQSRNLGNENINYQISKIPSDVEKLLERYVRPPYG